MVLGGSGLISLFEGGLAVFRWLWVCLAGFDWFWLVLAGCLFNK